jgi:hypothetical protein
MNYMLPAELREAILAYLKSKPYHEVADGVRALENLQPDGEG